jgi:hypothetical protein
VVTLDKQRCIDNQGFPYAPATALFLILVLGGLMYVLWLSLTKHDRGISMAVIRNRLTRKDRRIKMHDGL